jgi:hypothetical protein
MAISKFVRPETIRVSLASGDWLQLKKRLTAGDTRRLVAASIPAGRTLTDATTTSDPLRAGVALVLAYLVDWSLVDPNGEHVAIRGEASDTIAARLDDLLPEAFNEILGAVADHDKQMALEREAEKKTPIPALVS